MREKRIEMFAFEDLSSFTFLSILPMILEGRRVPKDFLRALHFSCSGISPRSVSVISL